MGQEIVITKADKFVIYGLAVMALLSLVATTAYSTVIGADERAVVICADGREIARYPLEGGSHRIGIGGPLGESVVEIASGKARMAASPCPQKICCAQGGIDSPNRTIICVPNRVVIKIESAKADMPVDAISR